MPQAAIESSPTRASAVTPTATSVRPSLRSLASRRRAKTTAVAAVAKVAAADQALEQGSVNRLRLYRLAMLSWCLGGTIATVLIPGTLHDRAVCWGSAAMFVASYLLRNDRGSPTERVRQMFPVAVVQSLAAMGVCLGLGVASPFSGLLTIGVVLYVSSAPRPHARVVFASLATSYAVLVVLVLLGALRGTGLLLPAPLPTTTMLANALWIEATLATGFLVGRHARQDTRRLSRQLESVVREAAHSEALLIEAQADLARIVKVGARGPFTGLELGGFRLGTVIGRGGMGEVYEAESASGTEPVQAAVKLLRRDLLTESEIVRRFERESRIVASLQSPHVVRVLAVGGAGAPLPFIAMERLTGKDLVALLRERPQIPLGEVEEIVRQVGEGLRVAHLEGVVHRDLKPANLYFAQLPDGESRWVVLDFGVSKLLSNDEATLTTDHVLGTPHYMSPEQAPVATGDKRAVDRRADLYALGMIAYRALTGQLAFGRGDMSDVIRALVHRMPADPRDLRPQMHEDISLWMRIAIAKDPDDRFATAPEMSEAFAGARRGKLAAEYRARAGALLAVRGWEERREDTKDERLGSPRGRLVDSTPSSRDGGGTPDSSDSSSAPAKRDA